MHSQNASSASDHRLSTAISRSWQLAWPLILANASLPLMGAVDTAVAGRLNGPEPLAAIALGASWITLSFWAFGFLRIAVGGLAAQFAGAQDRQANWNLLGQALILAIALGSLVSWVGLTFVTDQVSSLALAPLLADLTADYLDVRWWGAVLALGMYACHGWLMGQGGTKSLATLLIAVNLTNMFLSIGFALVLDWGVAGIAGATVVSQAVGIIAALWLCRKTLGPLQGLTLQIRGIQRLLTANGWVLLRALALMSVFTWFNTQSALLSPLDAAANAILLTLLSVAAYALDGFADAAEIETGQALGQRNRLRLKATFQAAAICSLIAATLASMVLLAGQSWWLAALSNQVDIIERAQLMLWWLIPMPLIAWVSYYFDGIFIGANAFKPMATIMLASSVSYFALWWAFGQTDLAGLWIAFWGFQFIRAAAMAIYFRVRLWPHLMA